MKRWGTPRGCAAGIRWRRSIGRSCLIAAGLGNPSDMTIGAVREFVRQ
ncbi:MAG TPA: hypothetical protein VHB18_10095 [Mycobacteriales bacterium]|nr:hypothetical protein [Mycobacteriales bacterium]